MEDKINPAHYKRNGVEAIDLIEAVLGEKVPGYYIGNIMKYVFRYENKNGVEDLNKAMWYLNRLIGFLEKKLDIGKEL